MVAPRLPRDNDPHEPAPRMPEAPPDFVGPGVEQLYTMTDVTQICRLSPSSVRRMVQTGEFPPPISMSSRLVRWRRSDIIAWQDAL